MVNWLYYRIIVLDKIARFFFKIGKPFDKRAKKLFEKYIDYGKP